MVRQRAVRTNYLIDQPVWALIRPLTARAAKTIVRWASMDSRSDDAHDPPPPPAARSVSKAVRVRRT
jgi:hypothetical protein